MQHSSQSWHLSRLIPGIVVQHVNQNKMTSQTPCRSFIHVFISLDTRLSNSVDISNIRLPSLPETRSFTSPLLLDGFKASPTPAVIQTQQSTIYDNQRKSSCSIHFSNIKELLMELNAQPSVFRYAVNAKSAFVRNKRAVIGDVRH